MNYFRLNWKNGGSYMWGFTVYNVARLLVVFSIMYWPYSQAIDVCIKRIG